MKKLRLVLATLVLAVTTLVVMAPPAPAQPIDASAPVTLPLVGTVANGGSFTGTLSNIRFVNQNGTLALAGTLTGTLRNAAGNVIGTVTDLPITLPIGAAQAAQRCTILELTLGPLDLNLLGLMVHLDRVHLLITAERGPGNLLGNLLCGLAHALDNPSGGGLANLLNRILGL